MSMLEFNTSTTCPQFKNSIKKYEGGEIDFSEFLKIPKPIDKFTFKDMGVLRIGYFNQDGEYVRLVTDEQLQQAYTRNELSEDRVQRTEDSYQVYNFVTSVEPPKISTDGFIIEGRGRIKAAMNREEEYIPIFIYDPFSPNLIGNVITAGLLENNPAPENSKEPNTIAEWALTIRGLVEVGPEQGGIKGDAKSITDKLMEMRWTTRWPRQGDQTKLKIQIDKELTALKNGDTMVTRRKETEVNAWVKENYSGSKNYKLICMDNLRYARQIIFEHVFTSVEAGNDPVHLILYTKRHTSSDAINNCKTFVEYLNEAYESVFDHVGTMQLRDSEISTFINQFNPDMVNLITTYNLETRPYIIDGCIPQVKDYHKIDGDKLVKVEDYGKKKPTHVKKKKTVKTDFLTIDESLGVVAA